MGNKLWTEEDDEYLLNNYDIMSIDELAETLYRTKAAISLRMNKFGIRNKNKWTEDKIEKLKEIYPTASDRELLDAFVGFDLSGIQTKASFLKIRKTIYKWSQEEIEYLKLNFKKQSCAEIALVVGKTERQVIDATHRYKIAKNSYWSDDELIILIDNYEQMNNKELAIKINRPIKSIICKAMDLGLKKKNFDKLNKDDFLEKFISYAKEVNRTPLAAEINSKKFGMSIMSIHRYFGSYRNLCKMCDLELNRSIFGSKVPVYVAKDGHTCWSKGEEIVCNFLFDHNIAHEKEVKYSEIFNDDSLLKICDWQTEDGTCVEFFGMKGNKYYDPKIVEKQNIFINKEKELISLFDEDLNNLENIFFNLIKRE